VRPSRTLRIRHEIAIYRSSIWVLRLGCIDEKEAQVAEGFVHTVHVAGRWENKVEGQDLPLAGTYETKEEATAAGRSEAQRRHTEHVIHLQDGSIEERNSYGGDPAHRPG
jgi:hypothetical protein